MRLCDLLYRASRSQETWGGQFEEARFPQLSGIKKECRQATEGTETPPCFHVWYEIKADRSTGSDKGF